MTRSAFWKAKRVLLTGHTGFKGSWLSLWLQLLGANLVGYSLQPPTDPSLFELADVGRDMKSVIGDIRDLEHLHSVFREQEPEIVIHMAAQPLVRYSYEHPVETYETNVMGTAHVLEAARRTPGVRAILCVTTDKCYENRETGRAYREDDPMGGFDPYSSSKGCCELIVAAYRSSFFSPDAHDGRGVAVASARAGNVIGGGDWARDRLVVDIMNAFLNKEPACLRNPLAVRPWQHVLDPLAGYLKLLERLGNDGEAFAEAWNFGPDIEDARPVAWIADRLAELWSDEATWQQDVASHPHEASVLMLDAEKAGKRLAWTPRLVLQEGLEWTVEWYREYENGSDLRDVTLRQIGRYETLVAG